MCQLFLAFLKNPYHNGSGVKQVDFIRARTEEQVTRRQEEIINAADGLMLLAAELSGG